MLAAYCILPTAFWFISASLPLRLSASHVGIMPMSRSERVNEQLRIEVSRMLLAELKDPRIGFVTVMRAEVSADLQHAHVYVSCLGAPAAQDKTLAALVSARGFVRKLVGARVRMRYTPEINFHLDHSVDDQFRIQAALDRMHKDQS